MKSLRSITLLRVIRRKLPGSAGDGRLENPATIWAPGGTRERSVRSGGAANNISTEMSGKNSMATVLFPWNRFICSTSESNCSNLKVSDLHEPVRGEWMRNRADLSAYVRTGRPL